MLEELDVELIRISKEYDIEIGYHIYGVEGGGYFASEIYTSHMSGIVLGGSDYLIPGLDSQLAGGYHTHGGRIYDGVGFFSGRPGDISYASNKVIQSGNNNYRFYMSAPNGVLKAFDAGRFQAAASNAERARFGGGADVSPGDYIRTLRGAK